MALLPATLGTRPRLAVEIRPEGVVAARADDSQAILSAVAYGVFAEGVLTPSLRPGNVAGRPATVAAVRKALEAVALKERQTTVVVPDAAVRVLLLDFDQLPPKPAEALPIVRFRLKKLLPFDADDAIISYQVMSSSKNQVRVLAVAAPKDVLAEYESIVREAGFEPGAVLPSTLAACAGMTEMDSAALLVNAGETAVTTAIVQGGILLLHRTVDLAAEGLHENPVLSPPTVNQASPFIPEVPVELLALPLVNVEGSAGEWAAQEPLNGYGVLDDRHFATPEPQPIAPQTASSDEVRVYPSLAEQIAAQARAEATAEAQAQVQRDIEARAVAEAMAAPPVTLAPQRMSAAAREVTQAVSVAAAYFEDTLQSAPGTVLAVGTLGASALGALLEDVGFGDQEIRVREMIEPAMLGAGALSTRIPHGWMAGVRGALRS